MFTQLRIQNFKAWKDTGNIRLAPLTVFFGPNSSGKTSLLQFLLLLKQTAQSRDRRQVLNFGGSHSYINFGAWPEMLFGGESASGLGFGLEWLIPDNPRTLEGRGFGRGTIMKFDAEIGSTSIAPIAVRELLYEMHRPGGKPPIRVGMRYDAEAHSYALSAVGPGLRDGHGLPAPTRFYGFPDEVSARLRSDLVDDFELALEEQLDSTLYLGPFREPSYRQYTWSGEAPDDVGFLGENTVAAVLAAQGRLLQLARSREPIRFEQLLEAWLVQMGVLESFETKPIASEASLYRIMVQTPRNSRKVNLADVGFGVSQVLPVLVQVLYAEPDTTLVFEQPELHLHPRVQSELADLFIETIQMSQGGKRRGIQCLVESHSEHFLRRLQRRIAEGKLAPDETALYFCKPGPDGSTIEELKLDEYGNISNWPENFFGDEVGDLAAMTEAAMKRHLGSEGE